LAESQADYFVKGYMQGQDGQGMQKKIVKYEISKVKEVVTDVQAGTSAS
jgi:hypothetical protein